MSFEALEMWDAMKTVKYRRTLDELQTVLGNAHGNPNEAISAALNMACSAIHAEVGSFWFYSRFGDGLIHWRAGYGGADMSGHYLMVGEGIAGKVIEDGEAIMISDCQKDVRWSGKVDKTSGFVTRSMMCVPLVADDLPFGCIQIINKTDGTLFDEKDLYFEKKIAEEISSQFTSLNLLADGRVVQNTAVMFVDIRGFTEIAEDMEPQKVAELLNVFLSYVTTCVKNNGGIADKYIGDCMMAYWIPSDTCREPAYMACRAAMDMISDVADLQEKLDARFGCQLQFGVGISCGPVFLGRIGTSVLTDHTVVGATVNTAAQLEAHAPVGKVYISRSVADALGKRARVTSLGTSVQLKSKHEPKEVLMLDALR